MKCKLLCHKLIIDYPDRHIYVVIGHQMARDYVDRFCNERSDFLKDFILGDELNAMFWSSDGCYLMCLPEKFDHTAVYHECFHACMRIWYDAGAKLEFPQNDEVITYMQGFMAAKIEQFYKLHENDEKT